MSAVKRIQNLYCIFLCKIQNLVRCLLQVLWKDSEFGTMPLASVMKRSRIWYNAKSQFYVWSYMCCDVCNTMFYLRWTKYTNILFAVMKRSSTMNQILEKKYKYIVCCYEQHKICSEPNSTKKQIYCMLLWKDHLQWTKYYKKYKDIICKYAKIIWTKYYKKKIQRYCMPVWKDHMKHQP